MFYTVTPNIDLTNEGSLEIFVLGVSTAACQICGESDTREKERYVFAVSAVEDVGRSAITRRGAEVASAIMLVLGYMREQNRVIENRHMMRCKGGFWATWKIWYLWRLSLQVIAQLYGMVHAYYSQLRSFIQHRGGKS